MTQTPDQSAVLQAFAQLLRPLLSLAIDRGVSHAQLDEQLRQLLVEQAREHHRDVPAHGLISRVSMTTGLNRREVTRLVRSEAPAQARSKWLAGEVFTNWLGDPAYRGDGLLPLVLPRQGAAPSFETLAQGVTRDVHPRSLLEELQRLGMVSVDPVSDTVRIERNAFVPSGDFSALMAFLSDNVGDHAQAAVQNVLQDPPPHFEQAIYADELSRDSIESFKQDVVRQWQLMLGTLVPRLTHLAEQDQAAGVQADQRLRVGFFAYHETMSQPAPCSERAAESAAPVSSDHSLNQGKP